MDSPLKYAGSKAKLMPVLEQHFPPDFTICYDLFCGGGGFFANLTCKRIIANDILKPLIGFYKWLARTPWDEVMQAIRERPINDKQDFIDMRLRFNLHGNVADFYVLAITCTAAMVRFTNGWMNSTYGGMQWNTALMDKLKTFFDFVSTTSIEFHSKQYYDIFVGDGAFVYLDPPYLLMDAGYNGGWGLPQEERLMEYLHSLKCPWMMSNISNFNGTPHPLLHDWHQYNVIEVEPDYGKISAWHKKDNYRQEVIIKNY